jgi:uncharacterized protein (TIGR03437 family)
LCRIAALTLAAPFLRAQSPPNFTATDLGILPGFAVSQATGINSSGVVIGYSSNSGFQFYGNEANGSSQAWTYSNGALTPLASNGQNATIPLGINASGQIVGVTGPAVPANTNNPPPRAMFSSFFYQNGAYNTPAAFPKFAVPAAINDAGQVPIWLNPGEINQNVALWSGGSQTPLPVPNGATTSFAFGINGSGQVAGGTALGLQSGHTDLAEIWANGAYKTLTVPSNVIQAFAVGVNDSGLAAGGGYTGVGYEVLLFASGGATDLGGLPGMSYNFPTGINNSGWIVGYSLGNEPSTFGSNSYLVALPGFLVPAPQTARAILSLNGSLYDLNSLVSNNSGWDFEYAYAINDAGQIVGAGFHNGVQTGFLLTPQASPPVPSISGVVSASAFGGFPSVAPGSWVEIYGTNLAPDTQGWTGADFTGNNAPTSLGGVSVSIGGQAAFVDYISATQVNAQLPSNIATGGMLELTLTNGATASAPHNIMVNATQPGLLAPGSFKIGGNQYVVALHSDGSYVIPAGAIAGVNSSPAQPGETVTMYGVGFGPVTKGFSAGEIVTADNQLALPFQLLFGQTPAQLPYYGLAPSFVGLYQFDVVVPAVADNDLVPLTFNLDATAGMQTLYTAVHQ